MEITWVQFAVVCPLVMLAGFVDAVAGGGGLISLPAYMLAGLPVHISIATNKLSSCMGTVVATARYARSGYVKARLSVLCAVCSLAGSVIGSNLSLLLSERTFKIAMLFILPLAAFYVLRSKDLDRVRTPFSERRTALLAAIIALAVGCYDGFYGPGMGTFLLLLLTGCAHMTLRDAAGTTKVINLASNVAALTVFLLNNQVLLPLGLTAGLFSIAGNSLGAAMFIGRGAKCVKPLMLTVLAVFFARLVYELFFEA
ncbi:MAG: TSUP family transporter [Oscillospiraceae bacterium]|nr:TSUP family transporter [Oscillospiraceae bacterium]